jgi:hypothetical protein
MMGDAEGLKRGTGVGHGELGKSTADGGRVQRAFLCWFGSTRARSRIRCSVGIRIGLRTRRKRRCRCSNGREHCYLFNSTGYCRRQSS